MIAAFNLYCERTGHTPGTASQYATKAHNFYERIVSGENFTISRYEKVMAWLKKNTPKKSLGKQVI